MPFSRSLRRGVERLAEFHDVDAALAQSRADRRRRIGGARGHLELDIARNLLRHFSHSVAGCAAARPVRFKFSGPDGGPEGAPPAMFQAVALEARHCASSGRHQRARAVIFRPQAGQSSTSRGRLPPMSYPDPGLRRDGPVYLTRSTCSNSSSTGVARPKIETDDLDAALLEIELLDQAVEARERAVEHLDVVADLVIDADLGLGRGRGGLVLGVEDARRLGVGDRLRLAA